MLCPPEGSEALAPHLGRDPTTSQQKGNHILCFFFLPLQVGFCLALFDSPPGCLGPTHTDFNNHILSGNLIRQAWMPGFLRHYIVDFPAPLATLDTGFLPWAMMQWWCSSVFQRVLDISMACGCEKIVQGKAKVLC